MDETIQTTRETTQAAAGTGWYLWVLVIAGFFLLALVGIKYYRSKETKAASFLMSGLLSAIGLVLFTAPMWDKVFIQISPEGGLVLDLQRQLQETQEQVTQISEEAEENKIQFAIQTEQLIAQQDTLNDSLAEARQEAKGLQVKLDDQIAKNDSLSVTFKKEIQQLKSSKNDTELKEIIDQQGKEIIALKKSQELYRKNLDRRLKKFTGQ